jgi:hypothetical protein
MLMGTCHCGSAQWTLEGDPGVITAVATERFGSTMRMTNAGAPRSRARRRPMSAATRTFGHWRFSSVRNAAACSAGAAVVCVRTAAAAWRSMCVWHRPKQSLIFGSSISTVSTNSPGFLPMEAVSETSGSDAPDTIRTWESLDGIFVDDGPLAEQFVVRGEIAIFRPWLKWWVSVWKSRKCFVFQWGLTDSLSASPALSGPER